MFGLGSVEMAFILLALGVIGFGLISMGQKAAAKEKAEAEPALTSSPLSERFHGHSSIEAAAPSPEFTRYCERCGNSIEDPKAFCPYCGVQL